uniref:Terpene synthase N-terminal domain-containing protein n=2 Tax=Oryza barthii TaxID=65489 RepID=A0A0D3HLS1_9ORYZ
MLLSSSCSGGQFPRVSPLGTRPKRSTRVVPLPVVTRATAGGVRNNLEVGGNAGTLQGMDIDELRVIVRKQLQGVELSPSSYDTAWVAMVPVQGSPQSPCFPQCVEWILQNQQEDGSWGHSAGPSGEVNKDILLSTLACVLALNTWNVGQDHIRRGLSFIGKNFSVAIDGQCVAPVGFNITFFGMLRLAIGMGLKFPVMETDIDSIFRLREVEFERDAGGTASARKAFMAYVSEGLGREQDWDSVMAYQRKNGSLFNSPSTTAASAIHSCNDRALDYLVSLTSKLGGPVPAIYPDKVYSQLCMVDTLEKMGISSDFACDIRDILDMTYSCWMQDEEEIMLDMATCAKAFRLLRMHGYDVSSEGMARFAERSSFDDSIHAYLNDTKPLLELYKSSQVHFLEEDLILENIGSWSAKLLKQQLSSNKISKSLMPEVEYALKYPFYATVEVLEHKGNIERFNVNGFQRLKSGYCGSGADKEILALAVNKFHYAQSVYQQELRYLESWVAEFGLDELKFARVIPLQSLLSAVVPLFPCELSDARIAWSQNAILTAVVDDLFDGGGSMEEMLNLVALFDKWDDHGEIGFCSSNVEIMFNAVYNTTKRIGAKAALVQKRCVMHHIAEQSWTGGCGSEKWAAGKLIPATMEEYMSVAEPSFALGPIVPVSAYLLGEELPEEAVRSPEYGRLLRLASAVGRLLNDVMTYEKEMGTGKLNSVVLLQALAAGAARGGGGGGGAPAPAPASVEAARAEVRRAIQTSWRDLHGLVFGSGGSSSIIPRPCREVFWHTGKVANVFYQEGDGYARKAMRSMANAVILDPLHLHE